jgi:hypothetical protein
MIATNHITLEDGQTFDRYSLNLAITGKYNGDGSTDANVAMRLVPTRIENGEVITADEAAIGIALGSLAGSDAATQQAVGAIQAALQAYIVAKGF